MRKLLCLTFSLVAGVSFGAYQYIISTDPALAGNPSESAVSSAISVNARSADEQTLATALETRDRTVAESNTSALNRQQPALAIVIR